MTRLAPEEPILAPGDEPPGHWVADERVPSARRWHGAPSWSVRHGPATCRWSFGEPLRVEGALLPDGSRGDAENVQGLTGLGWRRAAGDGGWMHGSVTFIGADATFVDTVPQPRPSPPVTRDDGVPDMEADMAASNSIRVAAGDDDFAQALYAAMCNVDWRKAGSARRWSCSWRSAGGVVADLRGRGEAYLDFYCSGIGDPTGAREGTVTPAVAEALARIGWRPVDEAGIAADHALAAARVAELLALPEADPEEWYRARVPPGAPPREPDLETWAGRMHHLAATGRVPRAEWDILWERLDLTLDEPRRIGRLRFSLGARPPDGKLH